MAVCFRKSFALCIALLQSFILVSSFLDCPDEFEDMCECGYVPYGPSRKLTYITNCTDADFDNTIMLRKLPPQTEILIFVGNRVKDLPLNIFGQDFVYEKLHTIDLSRNHIQTIKGRTFHNVANVTKLILDDNDLYIVSKDHHPRMFSNFVNLKELYLRNAFTEKVKAGDYLNNLAQIFENSTLNKLKVLSMENNEISSIYHGEFCALPALEELFLADNHLRDISLNFSCHKNLRLLDVNNNLISCLSDSSLKGLGALNNNSELMLNLTDNPFRCDCNMVKTYVWMLTTPLTLLNKDSMICLQGFPPIVGLPVFSVQLDELQCVPVIKKFDFHSSASLITLTVGMIFLFTALTIVIYKSRVALRASMRRVFYPIRSKFHYVSLSERATMDI